MLQLCFSKRDANHQSLRYDIFCSKFKVLPTHGAHRRVEEKTVRSQISGKMRSLEVSDMLIRCNIEMP